MLAASARPLTLAELTDATALSRATVHRIARQLADEGVITVSNDRYALSLRLFSIAGSIPAWRVLRPVVTPVLLDLKHQVPFPVHFGARSGTHVLLLEKLTNAEVLPWPTHIGDRFPPHVTGLGQAILAWSSTDMVRAVVSAGLPAQTPYTLTTMDGLLSRLQQIREEGVPSWARSLRGG